MGKTQKLTLTAMMVAIGTLTSHMFYIPIGFAKVFPMQHFSPSWVHNPSHPEMTIIEIIRIKGIINLFMK